MKHLLQWFYIAPLREIIYSAAKHVMHIIDHSYFKKTGVWSKITGSESQIELDLAEFSHRKEVKV